MMLAVFPNGNSIEASDVARIYTEWESGAFQATYQVLVELKNGKKVCVFRHGSDSTAQEFAREASAAVNRALAGRS